MAYTSYFDLDPVGDDTTGVKLVKCTPHQDQAPCPFYVEDIIELTQQDDFASIGKRMAKFWGKKWQVWVGLDADNNILKDKIALQCPPYYPPYTTVGIKLNHDDPQRTEFEKNEHDFPEV